MAVYRQNVEIEEKRPAKPTPAAGARPDEGPMTKDELQSLVAGLIDAAVDYVDSDLSPQRALATKYYKGEPFGNEEVGRSRFVSTDVRDAVQATLPPVLRVLFGPDQVVEFVPTNANTVAVAAQATEFCRYIFEEENDGFMKTLAVLKDGLVRKQGAFKWMWDETSEVKTYRIEGMTEEQLMQLASDPGVTLSSIEPHGVPVPNAPPTSDVEFTRKAEGCVKIYEVPPEELIHNREARHIDDAILFAHRTRKTTGDLIAMGIKKKAIEEHGGDDPRLKDSIEAIERRPSQSSEDIDAGEANEKHLYVESFARIDYDGDGIAELRRICTIGSNHHVVENKPADETPFSLFCPFPEPHTLSGQSLADLTMDMQRLKSQLYRSTLDSAAQSIYPRTVYKSGDVNLPDLLNTAIGAPIRSQSGPGSVAEFAHTFMGEKLLPLLLQCDEIIERRTGQSKGAMGMDADALQSSTKTAVAAAVTASQAQQEMIVRIFAEQTLKPMFRGILRLLVKYQPRQRMTRLRGQWVEVDPRLWDADMDMTCNVALGSGMTEEKVQTLLEISVKQENILQTMGQQNPYCNAKQYRDTLAEMIALRGRKDAGKYFLEITDEQVQQMAEAAKNAPPPPNPEQQMVEIEKQKAQAKMQLEQTTAQANMQLEQARMERQHQLEIDKTQREHQLESEKAARESEKDQREAAAREAEFRMKYEEMIATLALKERELELKYAHEGARLAQDAQLASDATAATERAKRHQTETQASTAVATAVPAESEADNGVAELATVVKGMQSMLESVVARPSTPQVIHIGGGKKTTKFNLDGDGNITGADTEEV